MSAIRIILLVSLIIIAVYAYRKFRTSIVDTVIIALLVGTGVILTLYPDLSTYVAHFLGVGRGVDLVIYLCIVLVFFAMLKLYARIRKLEQLFTEMIRQEALTSAVKRENPVG